MPRSSARSTVIAAHREKPETSSRKSTYASAKPLEWLRSREMTAVSHGMSLMVALMYLAMALRYCFFLNSLRRDGYQLQRGSLCRVQTHLFPSSLSFTASFTDFSTSPGSSIKYVYDASLFPWGTIHLVSHSRSPMTLSMWSMMSFGVLKDISKKLVTMPSLSARSRVDDLSRSC